MRIKKYCITLILLLFGVGVAHSQERHTEICIDFRVNSTVIDSAYSDNAARMQEMLEFLRTIRQDSTFNIIEVSFCGAASPEGSYQLNRKLAQGRLSALEKFIRSEVDIPDSLITYNNSYIPWDYLKSQIEDSGLIRKDEVITILEEEARLVDYHHPNTHIDNRVVKLRALDGGKVWQQMNNLFFEQMRNACAVFVTYKKELPPIQVSVIVPDTIKVEPIVEAVEIVPDTTAIIETVIPEVEEWTRKLHVKANAIGLGMALPMSQRKSTWQSIGRLRFLSITRLGTISNQPSSSAPSPCSLSSAIGCRKTTMVSLQEHISDWHTTILLLMAITATKTMTVRRLPSVEV